MGRQLPLVAVDTCIIVDFLTGVDQHLQESARNILDQHDKRHRVLLPAIVIAEIAGCGAINDDSGGAEARQVRIDKVHEWISNSRYVVADLTERIARRATRLASAYKLKGADASVLATAIEWNCTALYTRDKSLLKVDRQIAGLWIQTDATPMTEQEVLDLILGKGHSALEP